MWKKSVIEELCKKTGGIRCVDIKEKQFTCTEYIRMADRLVEKYL